MEVSLWTDLLIWTLYPWVDLIDDLTTMNGFSRKYNTTIHAAFFADFPINVSLKVGSDILRLYQFLKISSLNILNF